MRSFRSRRGSMLLELATAMALILLILGSGALAASHSRRIKTDALLEARAAALDRAQLEYLRRHPGASLSDPDAAAEITRLILRVEGWPGGAPKGKDASTLAVASFDPAVRPATISYSGRTYTFPRK